MTFHFKPNFPVRYDPRIYFMVFLCLNILLAYFSWPPEGRLWLIALGLFLPLVLARIDARGTALRQKPSFLTEEASGTKLSSLWIFLPLAGLAIALRFGGVGSLERWPGGDESLMALSVIQWMDHLQWKPFVISSQVPSTLSYLFFIATKLTGSFLLGVQFPSVLVSLITLALAYLSARQYFSRSLAWILTGLMAFNLWALLLSSTMEPGIFLPLWELGVFYVFGRLAGDISPLSRRMWAGGLGLVLGAGPYTFSAWPVLTALILPVAFGWFWKRRDFIAGGFFIFSFFWATVPFLAALGPGEYGGHIHDVAAWNNPSFSWIRQCGLAADYIQAIFWGRTAGMELAPEGGFLNVILGSFFFLGMIDLCRFRRLFLSRFLLGAFFIFLLPGLLSRDLEAHRILLVFPILLAVSAVGIQSWLLAWRKQFRFILLVVILLGSACLDMTRLYHPWNGLAQNSAESVDTNENRVCFRLLSRFADQEGPGWFFSDMLPNTNDYSLAYCTYPFNAAWNQRLNQEGIRWAAVFTERHYLPFLSLIFPSCRWMPLPPAKEGVLSRHVLGLIPVTPENRPLLERWLKYYSFQQATNLKIVDTPTGHQFKNILENFSQTYPLVPGDPFLQSCFFEKLLFNYSWEKTFHPEDDWTNWENFSGLFQESFEKSCQDFVLCEKFGRLLATEGKYPEAKRMFEKALRQNPGNQFLKYEIQQVVSWENNKVP